MNLVIVDTLNKVTDIRNFFGELQSLVAFMRVKKRTSTFYECQKKLNVRDKEKCRIRKLKNVSDTRWTSHDRVISVVHDKYDALRDTLKILCTSEDRVTSSNARIFLKIISSFNFILVLKLVREIFLITTPTSCYLQSKNLDFIQALRLIDKTKQLLEALRSDEQFYDLVKDAKKFAMDNNLPETHFKESRIHIRKKMPGEQVNKEITTSMSEKFKIDTYFMALDQIISSITNRYDGAREILKDLALLSPNRLMDVAKSKNELPTDSFVHLSHWIKDIHLEKIKKEYIVFSKNITELISGMTLPAKLHSDSSLNTGDIIYSDEECVIDKNTKNNCTTAMDIMNLISSYDLKQAFPNLYLAYKGLCTIPTTSASAERSFSKVLINILGKTN
ncbi:unnamed protein product [Aphis gossypii]|uniref:HAT C-terminal dimerisation domain-containing protein n=1 Tax=Aphis gossypii TaxID=80765 RepID=A0A9P0JG60_APHGO|nr:unnamed protein product [Aphis gossypii]